MPLSVAIGKSRLIAKGKGRGLSKKTAIYRGKALAMAFDGILYAGTTGQGVWRSMDGGETFHRRCSGMFMEAEVRALASISDDAAVLYAGTTPGSTAPSMAASAGRG